MGLFDFLGELLDSTEETIKDTSKNVVEKTPCLVTSAGKIAVNVAQKEMIKAGKKISRFQSEDLKQRLRDSSIPRERRIEMLESYIERKNNAVNASISVLNAKLNKPDLSDSERRSIENEIRNFEIQLKQIEHEGERMLYDIENYS